jgi:hypothetical protein
MRTDSISGLTSSISGWRSASSLARWTTTASACRFSECGIVGASTSPERGTCIIGGSGFRMVQPIGIPASMNKPVSANSSSIVCNCQCDTFKLPSDEGHGRAIRSAARKMALHATPAFWDKRKTVSLSTAPSERITRRTASATFGSVVVGRGRAADAVGSTRPRAYQPRKNAIRAILAGELPLV